MAEKEKDKLHVGPILDLKNIRAATEAFNKSLEPFRQTAETADRIFKEIAQELAENRQKYNYVINKIRDAVKEETGITLADDFYLSEDFLEAYGTSEASDFMNLSNEEIENILIGFAKAERNDISQKVHGKPANFNSLSLIRPQRQQKFIALEKIIEARILAWKVQSDKIGCAGFCEYLLKYEFFADKKAKNTRIKSLADFALQRYDAKIAVSLKKKSEVARIKKMNKLEKLFATLASTL